MHWQVTFHNVGDIWWSGYTAVAEVTFHVSRVLCLQDFKACHFKQYVVILNEEGAAADIGMEAFTGQYYGE